MIKNCGDALSMLFVPLDIYRLKSRYSGKKIACLLVWCWQKLFSLAGTGLWR